MSEAGRKAVDGRAKYVLLHAYWAECSIERGWPELILPDIGADFVTTMRDVLT